MYSKLEQLTPEQIKTIPVYIEKWKKISLSTERIDREEAEEIVNSIYEMLGYKSPNVLFFDSPYAACNFIIGQTDKQLGNLLGKPREVDYALHEWSNMLRDQIYSQINIAKIYTQIKHLGFAEQFNLLRGEIDCAMEIPYDLPTVQQAADSINWDIEPEEAEGLEIPF